MKTKERQPAVAGMFYDSDPNQLAHRVDELLAGAHEAVPSHQVAALIVPHAGYVYSGAVAAAAYAFLPRDGQWERIFIIGSSHRELFEGASVDAVDSYRTPLGTVPVDKETVNALMEQSEWFRYHPMAHEHEHTLEVQLPFLQRHLYQMPPIVPVVVGTHRAEVCTEMGRILSRWFNSRSLFIISTDFSHYPSHDDACYIDQLTANAILKNDPRVLTDQLKKNKAANISGLDTSLCGWSSVLTLLNITTTFPVDYRHLKYQNSGDMDFGDIERVVGYQAIGVFRKNKDNHLEFTNADQSELLARARAAFESAVTGHGHPAPPAEPHSAANEAKAGAFVSLYKDGKLRGCIGQFPSTMPLWRVIEDAARSAALRDSRFTPVTPDELPGMSVELSIITPLRRIDSEKEIVLGKHGIYIRKGMYSGTFLPQVADHTGWSVTEFLGHCARDKAGIGWDGWRDADLFVYEAIVVEETK
ncbi:hypothetical protein LX69_02369 [Breznakibacter xylanolyticus]|uniref:AMMECR1 domain-containing protein n=1 Tax=Breznakibacter xylanolyticus TaxID=990 RepID=A0A2W7N4A4_9BACT|nr:AmmeMemoRadiSam system protein B [Breznakibacter xylanolyticus]PZX14543.1 hypothetical protein LX69_02369 [Breznakibacter xylanolyticus]